MAKERMTKADIEKIEAELEHRKVDLRWKIAEAIRDAAAQGDRSENFEYYAAKRERSQNESRIRYLERLLKDAEVITDETAEDEVGLDSEVELYFPEQDMSRTVKLVTSIRGDSLHDYVSVEAPLGKALTGHREGERVRVTVDSGFSYEVEIRHIRKHVDESGDRIRSY